MLKMLSWVKKWFRPFDGIQETLFRELDTEGLRREFIAVISRLEYGDRVTISGGELGFGTSVDVYPILENAIKRGVVFFIYAGEYTMKEDKNDEGTVLPNRLMEYIFEHKPKNVNLYFAEKLEGATDFHFVISGDFATDVLIERLHGLSRGRIASGFSIKNSIVWSSKLLRYLDDKKHNYRKLIYGLKKSTNYEITIEGVKKNMKDVDGLEEIEKTDDYKTYARNRVGIFHDTIDKTLYTEKGYTELVSL